MARQVSMPQGNADRNMGLFKTILSSIPHPAAKAASVGVGINQQAKAAADQTVKKAQSDIGNAPKIAGEQQSAMSRRLGQAEIPIEERIKQLQMAEAAIPDLPQEVQEEVAPTIFNAIALTVKDARNQGLA